VLCTVPPFAFALDFVDESHQRRLIVALENAATNADDVKDVGQCTRVVLVTDTLAR